MFLLLQACLGLDIRAAERRVIFTNPFLPPFLEQIRIDRLRVGSATLDLSLTRHETDVGINVIRRDGDLAVVVVK